MSRFPEREGGLRIFARVSASETRPCEQPDEVLFFVRKTKTECKGCELPIIQERDDSAERE